LPDPSAWLWSDSGVYRRRCERARAACEAVVRALAARRPLGGAEDAFLDLHQQVSEKLADGFARAFADPQGQLWARLAFELTQALLRGQPLPRGAEAYARELGSREPAALLRDHLEQFKRFALGAALCAGAELSLETPLATRLPLALPGADCALEGDGALAIHGARGGRVGSDRGALAPVPCPRARVAGFELPLQPHGYALPGLGWSPPAARTDLAWQAEQVERVERALALVAEHAPASFAHLRACLRWIAISPLVEGDEDFFASHSDLPGAFTIAAVDLPWASAASCVHELHHNRLFCLEELEPILAGERLGTRDDAVCYSPWRQELRPVRGLLHAVYVFVPEGRYWLAVLDAASTPADARGFAAARAARLSLQLELGVRQLERYARLTATGEPLVAQLARDARAVARELGRAADPRSTPALAVGFDGALAPVLGADGSRALSAAEATRDHLLRFDIEGQIPPAWREELGIG
jgi:HEXXH motif-containing protein